MDKEHIELYIAPTTEVLEVGYEGVICQSGLRNGYGDSNPGVLPADISDGFWNW